MANWHSSAEGPWWKRLRIRLFGLTATERTQNFETMFRMRGRMAASSAEEDRLFDEYAALPGRPKVKALMRMVEGAPLEECELIDLDDFEQWRATGQ